MCKHFLCGYCPSELFTNTKADLGPCTDIHDEALRKDYQKSDRFEKVGYEERWIDVLERIVSDVDKKIKRGHARLSMTQDHSLSNVNSSGGPKSEQVEQLTNKIGMYLSELPSPSMGENNAGTYGNIRWDVQFVGRC